METWQKDFNKRNDKTFEGDPSNTKYSTKHGDNFDIVTSSETSYSSDAKIVTISKVIIHYMGGLDHSIEKYGFRELIYLALDPKGKWDKDYALIPLINTQIGDDFEIDKQFGRYIKGTVNDHLYPGAAYWEDGKKLEWNSFGYEPVENNNVVSHSKRQ